MSELSQGAVTIGSRSASHRGSLFSIRGNMDTVRYRRETVNISSCVPQSEKRQRNYPYSIKSDREKKTGEQPCRRVVLDIKTALDDLRIAAEFYL